MDNPNDYDDDAYLQASSDLQVSLPQRLEALWSAGADEADIVDELNNALDNASLELRVEQGV